MAETVVTYALTTKARVKDRLGITVTGFDTLFDRLISAATDFIETSCSRRFLETIYSNEVYSLYGQPYVLLNQSPVTALTKLEYRAGTPASPNWTSFIADQYELLESGKSGIVRIYGNTVEGNNVIRVSYTAGYKIDWANAGNATHTLPFDLSDLCERLAVRWFKRRELGGKSSEALQGGSINWKDGLDAEDLQTINKYTRIPRFV